MVNGNTPKILQVKCTLVDPIYNYKHIVFVSAFRAQSQQLLNNIICYENLVENFYPITHRNAHFIKVVILSEDKTHIKLKDGYPTIVHLELSKENMSDGVFLHLASNHHLSGAMYPTNSPSHFRYILQPDLYLTNDSAWGLSIDSITFPTSFPIFRNPQHIRVVTPQIGVLSLISFEEEEIKTDIHILPNTLTFSTIEELCAYLNSFLNQHECELKVSRRNRARLLMYPGLTGRQVYFSHELARILGSISTVEKSDVLFDYNNAIHVNRNDTYKTHKFPEKVNLKLFYPSHIFIYSSVLQESAVGNTVAPLAAIFHVRLSSDKYQTEQHFTPIYHKIRHSHLTQLDFWMRDITGRTIDFPTKEPVYYTISIKKI